MKKILLTSFCLLSLSLFAQNSRTFGFTAGINEYYAKPSFISAKSGTGYSVGLTGGFGVTKKSDIVLEATYTRFNMQFYGQTISSFQPYWIKFHSNRVALSALYYYDFVHLLDDDLVFGLHAGPTFTYMNNFSAKGRDNTEYELYPYDIPALNMKISRYYGGHLNSFASAGFNVHYKNAELNFRYHFALNSPYKELSSNASPVKIDGKDNFMSVTFNYYIRS